MCRLILALFVLYLILLLAGCWDMRRHVPASTSRTPLAEAPQSTSRRECS
jgi:hypothetical protein